VPVPPTPPGPPGEPEEPGTLPPEPPPPPAPCVPAEPVVPGLPEPPVITALLSIYNKDPPIQPVPVLNAGVALEEDPTFALIKQSKFNGNVGDPAVVYRLTLFVVAEIVTIRVGLSIGVINILSYIRQE
jgi:hypothetical protein